MRLQLGEMEGFLEILLCLLTRSDHLLVDTEKLLLTLLRNHLSHLYLINSGASMDDNPKEHQFDSVRLRFFQIGKEILCKELTSREGSKLIRMIEILRALTFAGTT